MGEWQARHGLSAAAYQATFDDLVGQGYRLTDVSGYTADGRVRYAAIWERQTGPDWRARHGIPGSTYQQVFNQMYADGFRPTRLSWYATPTGTEVAGIWIADGVAEWQAHHGLDAAAFDDLTARLADDHYHLIDIAAYEEQGQGLFAGIWQRLPGARPGVRINRDAAQHALDVAEMIGRRFVPLSVVWARLGHQRRRGHLEPQRRAAGNDCVPPPARRRRRSRRAGEHASDRDAAGGDADRSGDIARIDPLHAHPHADVRSLRVAAAVRGRSGGQATGRHDGRPSRFARPARRHRSGPQS